MQGVEDQLRVPGTVDHREPADEELEPLFRLAGVAGVQALQDDDPADLVRVAVPAVDRIGEVEHPERLFEPPLVAEQRRAQVGDAGIEERIARPLDPQVEGAGHGRLGLGEVVGDAVGVGQLRPGAGLHVRPALGAVERRIEPVGGQARQLRHAEHARGIVMPQSAALLEQGLAKAPGDRSLGQGRRLGPAQRLQELFGPPLGGLALDPQGLLVRQGPGESGRDGTIVRRFLLGRELRLGSGVGREHRRRKGRHLIPASVTTAQQVGHRGLHLAGRKAIQKEALQGFAAWMLAHPYLLNQFSRINLFSHSGVDPLPPGQCRRSAAVRAGSRRIGRLLDEDGGAVRVDTRNPVSSWPAEPWGRHRRRTSRSAGSRSGSTPLLQRPTTGRRPCPGIPGWRRRPPDALQRRTGR